MKDIIEFDTEPKEYIEARIISGITAEFKMSIINDPTCFKGTVKEFFEESKKILEGNENG